MHTHPLKALVFDFDGLLLDTEGPEFESWSTIYEEHGRRLELRDWHQNIGTDTILDPCAAFGHLDEAGREQLRQRKREMVARRLMDAAPREGIVPLLEDARQAGLALAVASSSPREWVTRWAAHHRLLGYFSVVCTREDVPRVKPDPALYHLAISRLGVDPKDGIALEDSRNGALAALAAGLRCVVYPNRITEQMVFPPACVRIDRLDGGLSGLLGHVG